MAFNENMHIPELPHLSGGGEMGNLIRAADWSSSPLGSVDSWHPALKQTVSMMLTVPFPVLICWGKNYIQLYNDHFKPVLGTLKHPGAMGGSAQSTFSETWDTLGPMFLQVMQGHSLSYPNYRISSEKDGLQEDSYYDLSYSPIKDELGNVQGILAVGTETTEKVNAINRLNMNKENIRNMVRQAPVGMCIIKAEPLLIEEVNDLFLEIIGNHKLQLDSADNREPNSQDEAFYIPLIHEVLRTGTACHIKEHEIRLTGKGRPETMYVDFVYEPMRDYNGSVNAVMILGIDVTDKVAARRKMQRAEEMLRFSIEAANAAVWHMDAGSYALNSSDRFKEIYGLSPDIEEVTYQQIINQIPDEYHERVNASIAQAIVKGREYVMEHPVIGYDGKIRWVKALGKFYPAEGKRGAHLSGLTIDITEQKQDELRKNDFIGMVSHELKTPLTSLSAITQLLDLKLKHSPDPFLSGAAHNAIKQVKRMSAMVNGFLNVSRLESGKIQIIRKPFNLEELLEEIIRETSLMASSHEIHFERNCALAVDADRDKIGSVISNLLSNAIKYSPRGKSIEVKCQILDKVAQVSIKDEGMGIKPQDKDKLFERYYRVTSNHTQHISGFGIGLYLCAEIIKRHEGKIWVESEKAVGSTFYFTLPLVS